MSTPKVVLRDLTGDDLRLVDRWFSERETHRWLGDQAWVRQLMSLAAKSSDRFAFAAVHEGAVVAVVDVERYHDARAAIALVVAPEHRRRGVAMAVVSALRHQPDVRDVVEFFAGVEIGNVASSRLVGTTGFEQVTGPPDEEGFTYYAFRTDGHALQRPWTPPSD